jgi:hypothetical protein
MVTLHVFTEDELSDAVACRLANLAGWEEQTLRSFRRGGSGYLRKRVDSFCEIARTGPCFVLTDLDRMACAPALLADWFGVKERRENLVFRVAVREVEAWLLADRAGLANFLGVAPQRIKHDPEAIQNPKEALLNVAKLSRPEIRHELLPKRNSFAIQGLGYNVILSGFAKRLWNVSAAAERSRSLSRALVRLAECRVRTGNED